MTTSFRHASVLAMAVAGLTVLGSVSWAQMEGQRTGQDVSGNTGKQRQNVTIDTSAGSNTDARADLNLDAATRNEVRARLSSIVNNALSQNGYDDLVGSLSREDRQRIGNNRYGDQSNLNQLIGQFNDAFRNKYNQNFDLKSAQLGNVQMQRAGEDRVLVMLPALGMGQAKPAAMPRETRIEPLNQPPMQAQDQPRISPEGAIKADPNIKRDVQIFDGQGMVSAPELQQEEVVYRETVIERSAPAAAPQRQPARQSARIGNPRSVDKKPAEIQVSTIESGGAIVHHDKLSGTYVDNPEMQDMNINVLDQQAMTKADQSTRITPPGRTETDGEARIPGTNLAYESNEAFDVGGTGSPRSGEQAFNPESGYVSEDDMIVRRTETNVQGDMGAKGQSHMDHAQPGQPISGALPANLQVRAQQLEFIREDAVGNAWRLSVPDSLTSRNLVDSLTNHLRLLTQNQQAWPSDVNQAYQLISYHIFDALTNPSAVNITTEK